MTTTAPPVRQAPTTSTLCPACDAGGAGVTGRIDVAEQHRRYFPADAAVAETLTRILRTSTTAYDLLSCPACGLEFASPMTAPSSAWYELAYQALGVEPEPRWEFDVVLARLQPGDTVYEIGCGMGPFLKACRGRGLAATGVDFSAHAVTACRRDGLSVEQSDLQAPGDSVVSASVAVSFQVLEHLDRPGQLFRHAAEVTRPGATLWVSVPSGRRTARALGCADRWDEPPHHLTRWTEPALSAVARRTGWVLSEVIFEPFSWRSALWEVASHFRVYERLRQARRLERPGVERALRVSLYPWALGRLLIMPRRDVSGLSLVARFDKTRVDDAERAPER